MLNVINNWRLKRKLLVAFSMIGAVILTINLTAILSDRSIATAQQRILTNSLPAAGVLAKMASHMRDYNSAVTEHIKAHDKPAAEPKVADAAEVIAKDVATTAQHLDPSLMPQMAAVRASLGKFMAMESRALELSRKGREHDALDLVNGDGRKLLDAALKVRSGLSTDVIAQAQQLGKDASAVATVYFFITITLGLGSIGALVGLWLVFNRSVALQLADLAETTKALADGADREVKHRDRGDEIGDIARAVESFRQAALARQSADRKAAEDQKVVTSTLGAALASLAQGDLTAEVTTDFPGETAALKANFNDAVANLRRMIGSVSESAASIRTGSNEIAQAAEDLARRTESNAASLEETSASLAQIDDRLRATAKAAARTVERADQAISTVGGGRAVAGEAVEAMERVRNSATGIDSVIEGLDKIAFQTRVLAMNAAVEAGRAGDAGRGFAVVADLVSSLAMRSEEEAKRARDQITVTQADIITAVGAVQRVDGAFADISEDVGEVHKLLGTMAADNQAQSSAITQISAAIGTMDHSTQQNAAMVEETSAAARNLTHEVLSLSEQAGLFKIDGAAAPAAAAPARKAKAQPARTAKPYVSPVKPLPASTVAYVNGAMANGADTGDWTDF